MPVDNSCVTLPGPWTHRFIQARGAQFHIATMGEYSSTTPLVLLVHGFPQYWWAFRQQIEPIADAGYRVAAVDLRGVGGSDKTPRSHDSLTLTLDLLGIVRALGASSAVIVGAGRGGTLAWSAAALDPSLICGLVTLAGVHPRAFHRLRTQLRGGLRPLLHQNDDAIRALLHDWSAPGSTGATDQADVYTQAMRLPGAANVITNQMRWSARAQFTPAGRAYLRTSSAAIHTPVLAVRGERDSLLPASAWNTDREFTQGPYRLTDIADAGHFLTDEAPDQTTAAILGFLQELEARA